MNSESKSANDTVPPFFCIVVGGWTVAVDEEAAREGLLIAVGGGDEACEKCGKPVLEGSRVAKNAGGVIAGVRCGCGAYYPAGQ